jgi:hypothetical protein
MAKPKVKINHGKIGDGWKRPFDDPIPLPRGRQFVTLKDAGTYKRAMKLPPGELCCPMVREVHFHDSGSRDADPRCGSNR